MLARRHLRTIGNPRFHLLCLLGLLLVLFAGCSRDDSPTTATVPDPVEEPLHESGLLASEIMRATEWPLAEGMQLVGADDKCFLGIVDVQREMIADDIAHYTFVVQTGPGEYDRIGLHRVVREQRPFRPERNRDSVFLLHGDGAPFVTAFMTSTISAVVPDDQNIGVYLARNDIDIWGIDLGWTLVPPGTTDFGFMADWGLGRDAADLRLGLATARILRHLSGNGWRKMHLLGWSRGVWTGLTYLNDESQRPRGLRHVAGFVPIDGYVKLDDEVVRQYDCDGAEAAAADIAGGNYVDGTGEFLIMLAELAVAAPDDPSPVFPGFTNRQIALAVGTSTYELFGMPWTYHLVAGVFDEDGMPTELQYTPTDLWFDFMLNWAPYQALPTVYEASVLSCDGPAGDLPYDDHYDDITVPVFYIGAKGGIGELGLGTLPYLGSSDVSTLIVQLWPDEDDPLDFAHVDIFNGINAEFEVWSPLLDWIGDHRCRDEDGGQKLEFLMAD